VKSLFRKGPEDRPGRFESIGIAAGKENQITSFRSGRAAGNSNVQDVNAHFYSEIGDLPGGIGGDGAHFQNYGARLGVAEDTCRTAEDSHDGSIVGQTRKDDIASLSELVEALRAGSPAFLERISAFGSRVIHLSSVSRAEKPLHNATAHVSEPNETEGCASSLKRPDGHTSPPTKNAMPGKEMGFFVGYAASIGPLSVA
jgi:hypothetical protein